jgi:hypothetical protein
LSGSFSAIGYDDLRLSNPRFFVPFIGLVQLLIFILISQYTGFDFLFITVPFIGHPFAVSLSIAMISGTVIAIERVSRSPESMMNVSYVDERPSGGGLKLSYMTKKGRRRDNLVVAKVRAQPRQPLKRAAHKFERPVEGTSSSMVIAFNRPRINLGLGFSSLEEMKRVYELLR